MLKLALERWSNVCLYSIPPPPPDEDYIGASSGIMEVIHRFVRNSGYSQQLYPLSMALCGRRPAVISPDDGFVWVVASSYIPCGWFCVGGGEQLYPLWMALCGWRWAVISPVDGFVWVEASSYIPCGWLCVGGGEQLYPLSMALCGWRWAVISHRWLCVGGVQQLYPLWMALCGWRPAVISPVDGFVWVEARCYIPCGWQPAVISPVDHFMWVETNSNIPCQWLCVDGGQQLYPLWMAICGWQHMDQVWDFYRKTCWDKGCL